MAMIKNRDECWIKLAQQTYEIQKMRKELEEKEDKLVQLLKNKSEDTSSRGGGYLFERIERKGSVQYTKIELLKQIDLELYRGAPSCAWKLTRE
jgi:hypothetical protein